jgi:hypothetical protein
VLIMAGLLTPALEALEPEALPVSFPPHIPRERAVTMARQGPSNLEVVDACRQAYSRHTDAVDNVTIGSVDTAQNPGLQPDIVAMHNYDWRSKVAAPRLAEPVLMSSTMNDARRAVAHDGAFATFFMGIEANVDFIVGGVGGVGVGFPFPPAAGAMPVWLAWGGLRIALNIDIAVNITTGVFLEPPDEVAGDYIGLDLSAEPVAEGPSIGFGIHLSPDLSKVRGFSIAVGVELGLLPITAAVVYGSLATSTGHQNARATADRTAEPAVRL